MIHIALLRGINVGGKNRLPMKDLRAMFETAGCRNVRTYIQSGNVLFGADRVITDRISGIIAGAVADRFGIEVPVVIRTAHELARVVDANPFPNAGCDERALHVAFLADLPHPDRFARLDPDRSPPDEFVASGREIYLHLPNGVGRSKYTNAYFDSTLGTVSTLRNWRTTLKLLGMVSGEGNAP